MRKPNHLLWLLPLLVFLLAIGAYTFGVPWMKKAQHGGSQKSADAQDADLPKGAHPNLTGHVHAQGGGPVQATVYIYTAAPKTGPGTLGPSCYPDCRKSGLADDQGAFKIEALDPQLVFRVLVVAKGYEPKFVGKINPAKGPMQVELKISNADQAGPMRSLHGRVLDAKGDPIEGAVVYSHGIRRKNQGEMWGQLQGVDPQAVTDEHGEFLMTAKEPFEAMDVKVEARSFANKTFPGLSSGDKSHDLAMTEGATVAGRVTLKGKPLAGVSVGLVSVDRGMENFTGNFDIATDADGKFAFMNVPPNVDYNLYGVMNSLKKYGAIPVTKTRSGNDGDRTKSMDLAVVPGYRIEGKVVLSDGKPVPAKTKLQLGRQDAWDSTAVTLDSDGSFDLTGIPGGGVSMWLRLQGYSVSKKNKSLDQLNPYELVGRVDHDISGIVFLLEKGKAAEPDYSDSFSENRQPWNLPLHGAEGAVDHSHDWKVTGQVTDGDTQEPLEHFQVIPGDLSRNAWQNPWAAKESVEGTNGQYTIYFDKRWGQPALQVKADGYLPVKVSILPLEQTNANATLKKGSGPSGAVRTADGKVVPGANVLLMCANDQNMSLTGSGELQAYGKKERITKTDASGRFTFAPELEMRALVASTSNGFNLVPVESFRSNANIILQPLGTIKGSLKRASGPGTNEDLDIAFAGEPGETWPRFSLNNHSQTDEQGRFEFDHVPPGHLQITYRQYSGAERHSWQNQALQEVTLLPGATIETNIQTADRPKQEDWAQRRSAQAEPVRTPTGTLKGKVFLPDGKPAADAQVALQMPSVYLALGRAAFNDGGNRNQIVGTNPKGEFTVPMFEDATAVIAVSEAGFAQATVDEMKASPKLTLQPWGRIEGTLHIGHHLGSNQVVVLSAGGFEPMPLMFDFSAFQARTDDQGHFVMTYVPPGERKIARLVPLGSGGQSHQPIGFVSVKAGGVTTTDVGGAGQKIIGRVKLPDTNTLVDWKIVQGNLHTPMPKTDLKFVSLKTPEEMMAYQKTPEFKAKMKENWKNYQSYQASFSSDGSFTAEEVPPGNYEFDVQQFKRSQTMNPFERLGHGEITVPKTDSTNDAPVDLGVLELKKPVVPKLAGASVTEKTTVSRTESAAVIKAK